EEMLTGVRPFPGTTAVQLAAQHLTGRPALNALPPHDRPIIARALSKIPEQRFANCRELIAQLEHSPAVVRGSVPVMAQEARRLLPVVRPPAASPPWVGAAKFEGKASLESTIIRKLDVGPSAVEETSDRTSLIGRAEQPGERSVRPTLYVGMGGLAGQVLCRLKRRMARPLGNLSAAPFLQFLYLDVDRRAIRQRLSAPLSEAFAPDEVLLTALHPPAYYRDRAPQLRRWLERRWQYSIPRSLCTEGIRPLGRLALMDNLEAVLARLRATIETLTSPEARAAATVLGLNLREQTPRIFLVASISGGTGGGMAVEAAYALRQVLDERQVASHGVCGLLLHAIGKKPAEREMACVNAVATLTELGHYSRPDRSYPGD